jgi:hypothetical protein
MLAARGADRITLLASVPLALGRAIVAVTAKEHRERRYP